MKFARWVAVFAVIVIVLLLVCVGMTLRFANSDRICSGVTVSGRDIGGMTRGQAERILQDWAIEQSQHDITLTAMDRRWGGTFASLGIRVDWKDAVARAFAVGREGNLINRSICALTSGGIGKNISAKFLIDKDRLQKTLAKVNQAVGAPHRDAKIRVVDSRIEIEQDSCGTMLDEAAAVGIVSKAVLAGEHVVQLPVVPDEPEVTARDALGIDALLSSYTTSFNRGKVGRTHNLTLAAKSIDGIILKPGQEFSYNKAVGPRILDRGFQMAQVFVKGKLEDGIGGGVCQVSSTLFNAVLLAGLAVKERNPHSQLVPYVSAGRDATVAYGHLDFRFQNNNASPIGVVAQVKGSRLSVRIYGSANDVKVVKVYTGTVKRTAAGSETHVDRTLPSDAKRIIEKGARGADVVLYRRILAPDGNESVEAMRSKYRPQNTVYAVGPTTPSIPE